MRTVSVEFDLKEEHVQALEELLPYFKNWESQDKKPFANWTIEDLFKHLMLAGSFHRIEELIKMEQYRQDLITFEERMEDEFLTISERQKRKEIQ